MASACRALCHFSKSDSLNPVVTTGSSTFEEKIVREFTIGQLSKLTDVNIETIRYYEKIGIMPSPPRNISGYRIYSDPHLERLSFVRRSKELGFSQPEVRKLLTLVDDHQYTCAEVQGITANQLAAVRTKIKDLRNLERALATMVSECVGGDVPDCHIIDTLSATTHADIGTKM
jgi:MerR family mercuric resistance operon transcriptional regulator